MTKIRSIFLAAVILAVLCPVTVRGEVTVKAHSEVLVRGPKVFLGEVSEISGGDQDLIDELAHLELARSPRPGNTSHIRESYVNSLLRRKGFPLDRIELEIPKKIIITRESQTITAAWVRSIVEKYISRTEPYKSGDWELIKLWTGRIPQIPAGKLEYNIVSSPSVNPSKIRLKIFILVDGRNETKIRANCQIDLKTTAVVAVRRLEAGDRIRPGDLRMQKISLSAVRKGALTSPNQGVGMIARKRINPGEPLRDSDLEQRDAVEKGDMVNIIAANGFLKVSSPGQVKQDGALGDNVPVLNLSSKKIVIGRVISSETVEVAF
jgi:flagella basal body P-ring formation protein FlgA